MSLLNQQQSEISNNEKGRTLREKIMEMAKSRENQKEINIDIPLEENVSFVSLPDKIHEALQMQTS